LTLEGLGALVLMAVYFTIQLKQNWPFEWRWPWREKPAQVDVSEPLTASSDRFGPLVAARLTDEDGHILSEHREPPVLAGWSNFRPQVAAELTDLVDRPSQSQSPASDVTVTMVDDARRWTLAQRNSRRQLADSAQSLRSPRPAQFAAPCQPAGIQACNRPLATGWSNLIDTRR